MIEPRISSAMARIDDELIAEAVEYKPQQGKAWKKWAALVACICLVLLTPLLFIKPQENVPNNQYTEEFYESEQEQIDNNVEFCIELTLEEALLHEVFGEYFPTVIPEGYRLESTVNIYGEDETVMDAWFLNEITEEAINIQIANKSFFGRHETGVYTYRPNGSNDIYLDCGEYIVYYSSSKGALENIEGFEEMIYSSKYFIE